MLISNKPVALLFFIYLYSLLCRFSKAYRHPELDATLTKERHRAECRQGQISRIRLIVNYNKKSAKYLEK